MNPGIYYFYEYENKQRRRNVGFLKISRHYHSCILQIHIRGIPAGNGASLELFAFCVGKGKVSGAQIATLTCFRRSVSARLPVSESVFPEGHPLPEIDGFLLRLPGESSPVFWAASESILPADIDLLRAPLREPSVSEAPAPPGESYDEPESPADTASPIAEPLQNGNSGEQNSAKEPEENGEESLLSSGASEQILPPESAVREPSLPPESKPAADQEETEDPTPGDRAPVSSEEISSVTPEGRISECPRAKKIQRSDISSLPRRFWFLANNSFLLHGYHNYNHLLLVEEDGHMWLGVPGIYHPREARAADLFGFPQFTRDYADTIGLSGDERSDGEDFGHWCRYLDSGETK